MARSATVGIVCTPGVVAAGITSAVRDRSWEPLLLTDLEDLAFDADLQAIIVEVAEVEMLRTALKVAAEFEVPAVALVQARQTDLIVECLRSGCAAALPLSIEPTPLMLAVELAMYDLAVTTVTSMSTLWSHVDGSLYLTDDELDWLARLASGGSVATLAADIGYSERTMYRHLAVLYQRLGIQNRSEAISEARRRGLL